MQICSAWDDSAKASLQMSITMAMGHSGHYPMNWSYVSSCQWLTDVQAAISVVLLPLNLRHMSSLPLHHQSHLAQCSPSGSQFASLGICPPLSIHRFTAALNAHIVVTYIFKLIILPLGFCWVIYFLVPTSFFLIHMVHEIHTNQRREWKSGDTNGKELG